MYADRYARPEGIKPGSLTVAIGINAGLIGALLFASPAVRERIRPTSLKTWTVPPEPIPEPLPPEVKAQPQQKATAQPRPERVETAIAQPNGENIFVLPPMPPLPGTLEGTGTAAVKVDPPVIPPVFVDAKVDPRYARMLQPAYPAGERRMGNEGRVVVKVLVGVDGRVKQVERVSATSDAFFRATEDQARARWRFVPATRDGVPVETWRTMSLRFEMDGLEARRD